MTNDEYEAVKAAICPYCAAKLPDTLHCGDEPRFVHAVSKTDHRFACQANGFRTANRTWVTE